MEASTLKKKKSVKPVEYMTEEMMRNIYVFQEPYNPKKKAKPVISAVKLGGFKK